MSKGNAHDDHPTDVVPLAATESGEEGRVSRRGGVLTRVGAGQVVSGVGLLDDVLVDLVPLALSVAPETERQG